MNFEDMGKLEFQIIEILYYCGVEAVRTGAGGYSAQYYCIHCLRFARSRFRELPSPLLLSFSLRLVYVGHNGGEPGGSAVVFLIPPVFPLRLAAAQVFQCVDPPRHGMMLIG